MKYFRHGWILTCLSGVMLSKFDAGESLFVNASEMVVVLAVGICVVIGFRKSIRNIGLREDWPEHYFYAASSLFIFLVLGVAID